MVSLGHRAVPISSTAAQTAFKLEKNLHQIFDHDGDEDNGDDNIDEDGRDQDLDDGGGDEGGGDEDGIKKL